MMLTCTVQRKEGNQGRSEKSFAIRKMRKRYRWSVGDKFHYTHLPGVPRVPICHNYRMCGGYRLSRRKQLVAEYFDAYPGEDKWDPRYNIAPTPPVPVARPRSA